jgi:hypothetical protein
MKNQECFDQQTALKNEQLALQKLLPQLQAFAENEQVVVFNLATHLRAPCLHFVTFSSHKLLLFLFSLVFFLKRIASTCSRTRAQAWELLFVSVIFCRPSTFFLSTLRKPPA